MRKLMILVAAIAITVLTTGAAFNCEGGGDCEVLCFD